jgi:pimeloyl-ACP methyl ester carboxylesterase
MEPRFVEANGVRFAYLEHGKGPLVILMHGFPDTAHSWDRALPALAGAGFRAVAPFQRGYHPTQVPGDGKYDSETLGRDVLALIAMLGEDSAIVVGHDWGASAAYAAATLEPARVRLLVTLAIPHPASLKPTPGLLWALRHFIPLGGKRGAKKLARHDFAYVDTLWRRWSPGWHDLPAAETAAVKAMFRDHPQSVDAACGYYRAVNLPRVPPPFDRPITVPTVSFAGESDMIPPRAYEKARRWFAASYEVVQVPGGHFMHREHPEPFVTELVRVVQRYGASPP